MRGVAAGVFGGAAVSAAITETGDARTVAAVTAMNDLTIVSAGVLFMERLVLDRPAAVASAGGNTDGKQQRFPMKPTPVMGISRELE
jgi:hypothetical protein